MIKEILEKMKKKPKKRSVKAKLAVAEIIETPIQETEGKLNYTRKRAIGTEQEYGVWSSKDNACFELKKGDKFISNGGLIYNDCNHPEYASPETSNPLDAVKYSKAGEIIIQREVRGKSRFFKHITDGNGNFFGAHESYTLRRSGMDNLTDKTLPFFATRIIFAGAGGVCDGKYEISQKARRINYDVCNGTGSDKSIFNTRDEPLSDKKKYRRLHLISGDANMSEIAEYLKLGTTALVLDLFEDGKLKAPKLKDSLSAFHYISRDLTLKGKIDLSNWRKTTAIKIQRQYQEAAESTYRGRDTMTNDILNRWGFVLDGLESQNKNKLAVLDTWLDWRIKKKLIDGYMDKSGKSLTDISVKNIDLMYHEVDKKKGLFYILQNRGLVDRLLTDEQIEHAVDNPPKDTRAYIRGKAVQKGIRNIYWNHIISENLPEAKILQSCGCCYETRRGVINDPLNNYKDWEKKLK